MAHENIMDLNFRSMKMSIKNAIDLINRNELKLEYFREKNTEEWDTIANSEFIESILIRAPMMPIVVHENNVNLTIIDGLQRMKAIHQFVNNEFRLGGLNFLHDFDHFNWDDFHRGYQRRIEETYITLYAIESPRNPALSHRIASKYL